jgi:hypothetical protein
MAAVHAVEITDGERAAAAWSLQGAVRDDHE